MLLNSVYGQSVKDVESDGKKRERTYDMAVIRLFEIHNIISLV